jgi:membrane-bound ClpP family serine protease
MFFFPLRKVNLESRLAISEILEKIGSKIDYSGLVDMNKEYKLISNDLEKINLATRSYGNPFKSFYVSIKKLRNHTIQGSSRINLCVLITYTIFTLIGFYGIINQIAIGEYFEIIPLVIWLLLAFFMLNVLPQRAEKEMIANIILIINN